MKFKIWDDANKIMYYNAEQIDDPKWNFARLHRNIHCVTCITVGAKDKNDVDIYTFDLIKIGDLMFYVDELFEGEARLRGLNSNIEESISNFDSNEMEVIGSSLELE